MRKLMFACLALILSCNAFADGGIGTPSDNEHALSRSSGSKNRNYDREALTREIDETMVMLDGLCLQIQAAPKSEADDVWLSGTRDFKLESKEVKETRKACDALIEAANYEKIIDGPQARKAAETAKELRSKARDLMREHHKKQTEEYVRDLRNWITVSEGVLRRVNEKAEKEKAKP